MLNGRASKLERGGAVAAGLAMVAMAVMVMVTTKQLDLMPTLSLVPSIIS